MKIQQFADLLKQRDPSPFVRALQELRLCSLTDLKHHEPPPIEGWYPWMDEAHQQTACVRIS